MCLGHGDVTKSICTPSRATILTGTHHHVNGVMPLGDHLNNRLPNVARHLRSHGYETAIFGQWHLGEGPAHQTAGFDDRAVVPGQGNNHDPVVHHPDGVRKHRGYASEIITDLCLDWRDRRDTDRPFFLMCHHKAPHRSWEYHPKHEALYTEDIALPVTFDDYDRHRASGAAAAKTRASSSANSAGSTSATGTRNLSRCPGQRAEVPA